MEDLPWRTCFVDPDDPSRPAEIELRQVTARTFELRSSLRYVGPTGGDVRLEEARTLRPADLGPGGRTDLATVPPALRWFVSPYGLHTPAALVHDRLIGGTGLPDVPDVLADRYFRFMLRELGVRWLRRWMMWAAVALGTRWRAGGRRRLVLVVWLVLALSGMTALVAGVVTGRPGVVVAALVAPFVAALLWGRQYGAGVIASLTAVWVLPPTVLGAVGFWVYSGLERLISLVLPGERHGQPPEYKHF